MLISPNIIVKWGETMNFKYILAISVLSGLSLTNPANAEIKWQTDSSAGCSGSSFGNNCNFSAGGVSLNANAWSNTAGSTNTQIETAYLGVYAGGGLGVTNRDACTSPCTNDAGESTSPEHSMDNNGRFDSILFSFSSKVALSKVEIGYKSTDSDISVLAYIGGGAPVLSGATYANLQASSDWVKIGNYADLATNTPKLINSGKIASSYWLIGAYNAVFGGALTSGDDNVKLLALYGDKPLPPSQVPLPSTLLLMGAGVLGLMRFRKR